MKANDVLDRSIDTCFRGLLEWNFTVALSENVNECLKLSKTTPDIKE